MTELELLAQTIEPTYTYSNYPRRIRHQQRTAKISEMIAQKMGMPGDEIEKIIFAARFCNNCERFWPDYMTEKAHTEFSWDDLNRIKAHPTQSASILEKELSVAGNGYPRDAIEIIKYHHETYTPSQYGYPAKKFGEDIPIGSRIIFVAESYDAMRSPRDHRNLFHRTWTHSYAIDEIVEKTFESKFELNNVKKDAQYCSKVVYAFMQVPKYSLDELYENVS